MILSLPFFICSISVLPRIITEPRPVVYALTIPLRPNKNDPVGKSGPLILDISSAIVISELSANAITPSITSPKLCGGILVAIPTAIPLLPLTNKFGILAGNTFGSCFVPS